MKEKIVIKIGTSTLTKGGKRISYGKIEEIAKQCLELKKDFDIVLVSSGAIASAKQFIDLDGYNKNVDSKQAMAAIGQPKLLNIYDKVFNNFDLKVAQCLMTYRDFENPSAIINTKQTILKLLEHSYIPIINENDTIAIEEIVLGDNDKLSALVASILKPKLLILISDIDGLYDKNPHINDKASLIPVVSDLSDVYGYITDLESDLGTGGMYSKIEAAKICKKNKIEMWIVNGKKDNFIIDAMGSKINFTKFEV